MTSDYAKELTAVYCGRVAELLDAMRGLPLSDEELACWEDLYRAARRGAEVFKVAGGETGC